MLRGNLPAQVKRFHDQYGPVVRVAPDELSFLDGWKDIYSTRYLDRPPQWRILPPGQDALDLVCSRKAEHSRFRKAILPAFSHRSLEQLEPIILNYFDHLMKRLVQMIGESTDGSSKVDLVKWISYTAFDLTGDLGWGRPLDCLNKGHHQPWMEVITHYKAGLFAVSLNYFALLQNLFVLPVPSSILKMLNPMDKVGRENVEYRLGIEMNRPDFISPILAYNKSNASQPLSVAEIQSNSTLFVLGGTEPLTVAITGTLHCLLSNPSKMKKLLTELRYTFNSDKTITGSATEQLSYLNAVIKEGLRMCPPFPDSLRRIVPKEGAIIDGVPVPGGMTVSSACWATFQSTDMFYKANCFIPERWLDDASQHTNDDSETKANPFAADAKAAFHPFSLGPRNCVAQKLAMMEMRVLLSKLMVNFDMALPEGNPLPLWTDQKIFWHWAQEGFEVEIKHRTI